MNATIEPATPRTVLALIALAADLPVPKTVRFSTEPIAILTLDFDALTAAAAWCSHLGGVIQPAEEHDGRLWFRQSRIEWQGWSVHLGANEPVVSDPLRQETADRLSSLIPDQAAA